MVYTNTANKLLLQNQPKLKVIAIRAVVSEIKYAGGRVSVHVICNRSFLPVPFEY
jgi:hypothetical protein